MALKRVRRPVLGGEKEFLEKRELETSMTGINNEKEFTEEQKSEPKPNHLNSFSVEQAKVEEEVLKNNQDNKSLLCRQISFIDGKVKIPRKAKVDKGSYFFRINSIMSKEGLHGKYGAYDQYLVSFSLFRSGDEVPVQVTIPYTISSNPNSPLMQLLMNFKSFFEGQSITINQLVGWKGSCEINYYITDSGDEYERLTVKHIENPKI
ncbi:hypothetical protein [Metabacillus litoralis]|uniref:Uncharacterized protein n=1 Tax=Metabacillus litoralis TaxID=152268 RepID=A0A179SN03_9BACI|nr:hypothetical protein [Metabacillus litoralis]OAS83105.1 hypothetical protein A6K24_10805 [Metabacillus litoralis]